ncbi:MAG: hypothetical protein KF850_07510 [Labilithrix sp.]|nr:hypothetical protein [Labilithrix sp.]
MRVLVALPLLGACVAPEEGVRPGTALHVAQASAMTAEELAHAKERRTAYGWKLEIAGESARFFACADERTCGDRVVDLPAKSVVAVARVGRVNPSRADGTTLEETDLLRLTLADDAPTSRGGAASDPHRGMTVSMPPAR